MKRIVGVAAVLAAAVAVVAISYHSGEASDHDDGEQGQGKKRSLNLTDHFTFKSPSTPSELSIITYFNPRSLPQRQYGMEAGARYEQHVTKIADKTTDATGKDDIVFRFEATAAPDGNGVQPVKLTVLKDMGGTLTEAGSTTGSTTSFAGSSNNSNLTTNTATNIGGIDVKWFIGMRADSFHFDVNRFFEVRAFLAKRLFGGPNGATGDATATLAPNCRGDQFLAILGLPGVTENGTPDADTINLFNPPSCAPDFTKSYNVTAIVLNVPIAQLGGSVFDTWSTISVQQ